MYSDGCDHDYVAILKTPVLRILHKAFNECSSLGYKARWPDEGQKFTDCMDLKKGLLLTRQLRIQCGTEKG